MRTKHSFLLATFSAVTVLSIAVTAQTPPPDPHNVFLYRTPGPVGESGAFSTFEFIRSEINSSRVVKGAPYSADAVTETTQLLGDGNRIVRKTRASLYRDSEGRTRRDETLGAVGPWATADAPRIVTIFDPVAKVSYTLNSEDRVAHKITTATGSEAALKIKAEAAREILVKDKIRAKAESSMPREKNESLGKQTIEGVEAEGTRSTLTIPAGEIGNERAIEMVSERWYSSELQTNVMTKRTDPRFGDTVFRLTNISRSEPSPSLFVLPADYTVKEEKSFHREFRRQK